jgi:chromosome segregation ATPase
METNSLFRGLQTKFTVQTERVRRADITACETKERRSFEGNNLVIQAHLAAHYDSQVQRRCTEIKTRLAEIDQKIVSESAVAIALFNTRSDDLKRQKERMDEEVYDVRSAISNLEYQLKEESLGRREFRLLQDELESKRERLAKLEESINKTAQSSRSETERLKRARSLGVDEDVISGKKSALVKNLETESERLKSELRNVVADFVRRFLEIAMATSTSPPTVPTRPLEPQRQRSFSRLTNDDSLSPRTPQSRGSMRRRSGTDDSVSSPGSPRSSSR